MIKFELFRNNFFIYIIKNQSTNVVQIINFIICINAVKVMS